MVIGTVEFKLELIRRLHFVENRDQSCLVRVEPHDVEHRARLDAESEARGTQGRLPKIEQHPRAEGAVDDS